MPWGPTPITDACHDITSFPEIGLAAGACEGNGILIDISDPANPVRIDEVADPNFAYWHSATFNNDGTKVIFTDEWGGGTAARCRTTDQPQWGANAIFDIVDGQMQFASYYKLPVPQTLQENCVAHNASLVPVPGRDILVQAWYQGGISMIDFTDSANPVELAFFDRGPISATSLVLGGFWSAYWYNGSIFGSEIARGFDVFGLLASQHLSEAEVAAAGEVQLSQFNPQHQAAFTWAPSRAVARARFDQLARTCTSTITGDHNGSLVVSGVTCLDGANVRGGVIDPGRRLAAVAGLDDSGRAVGRDRRRRAPLHHDRSRRRLDHRNGRQRRRGGLDRPRRGHARRQRHRRRRADPRREHDPRFARLLGQRPGADRPRCRQHGARTRVRSVRRALRRPRPRAGGRHDPRADCMSVIRAISMV